MFHDRTLQNATLATAAFNLNAYACKLMLLVQWYSDRGEKTLPVSYIKRLGFTRRQWELATKGTRVRDENGKLGPIGKDGLQATGMIAEVRMLNAKGKNVTYWVIGEPSLEKLEAIRDELQNDGVVIEGETDPGDEKIDRAEKPGPLATCDEIEKAQSEAYAHGEAVGYQRGYRNGYEDGSQTEKAIRDAVEAEMGCRFATSLTNSFREADLEQPENEPENPNQTNLSALFALSRGETNG